MASPDFFSQLPSLEELLSHPRVTAAVERLNRSSTATRVRTAFAELAGEVTRRTDELSGLTPAELLERFVGRIERAAQTHEPAGAAVNATGTLRAAGFVGARLPTVAVSAAAAVAGGARRANHAAEHAAAEVIGCQAACVLASHAAALRAALEAVAPHGVIVVARADMHSLADGGRVDRLVEGVDAELVEVGAADSVRVEDYAEAIAGASGRPVAMLVRRPGSASSSRPSVREIAAMGAVVVCDLSGAAMRRDTPGAEAIGWSADGCLGEGAQLVVLDTGEATGGPAGGLVAGGKPPVDRVRATESAAESPVEPMIDAALEATLRLFHAPERLRFTHPRYTLLDTPGENLRLRAERLAQLLEASGRYEEAEAVELASAEPATDAPTWGVRLRSSERGIEDRLAAADPAIAVRREGDAIVIDLRTVFPGEDATLSRALGGDHVPAESAEGGSAGTPAEGAG